MSIAIFILLLYDIISLFIAYASYSVVLLIINYDGHLSISVGRK